MILRSLHKADGPARVENVRYCGKSEHKAF